MTLAHYDAYIRTINCGDHPPDQEAKFKFRDFNECFYRCFGDPPCESRYDDPSEIVLLTEEQARTARCLPYVDREEGGLLNACDSLPGDCPECEPVDCCIKLYHGGRCDEWTGSRYPGPSDTYTLCNYGTHARIYRTYSSSSTLEIFEVEHGTRPGTYPPDWPPQLQWCIIPACLPERLILFERTNESYIYDGTCRKCYREEGDPDQPATRGTARAQYSFQRFGFSRQYCKYPEEILPDGRGCGTDWPNACLQYTESPINDESGYDRDTQPCIFAGPSRGPRLEECPNEPAYERVHDGCVIRETWRTVQYSWSCGGAEKTWTSRTEYRHAAADPNDPARLCWPPYGGFGVDQSCPEAVGKLIRREQYSYTDRVNVTVLDRTAYYGDCPSRPPTSVAIPPRGGRNRTRSTDIL